MLYIDSQNDELEESSINIAKMLEKSKDKLDDYKYLAQTNNYTLYGLMHYINMPFNP